MRGYKPFVALLIIAAAVYAAVTCVQIEVLNCRAGYYLPHDDTQEPHSKWRWSADINEGFWKERHHLGADGKIDPSPLSDVESAQMKRDIQNAQNIDQLHEVVQTRGVLQYPACVVVLIGCALFWRKATMKSGRILVFTSAIISIVALGFAMYRGYFTSLGL